MVVKDGKRECLDAESPDFLFAWHIVWPGMFGQTLPQGRVSPDRFDGGVPGCQRLIALLALFVNEVAHRLDIKLPRDIASATARNDGKVGIPQNPSVDRSAIHAQDAGEALLADESHGIPARQGGGEVVPSGNVSTDFWPQSLSVDAGANYP
jgi:hypothetical protein